MIKTVHRNTAKNPVARAVAQAKPRSTLTTQKIALYMMEKGEECHDLMDGLRLTLAVIGFAWEWQNRNGSEEDRSTPDIRILRGGMSACISMLHSGYDPINTVSIDSALSAAERINKQLNPESIQYSWLTLNPANQK